MRSELDILKGFGDTWYSKFQDVRHTAKSLCDHAEIQERIVIRKAADVVEIIKSTASKYKLRDASEIDAGGNIGNCIDQLWDVNAWLKDVLEQCPDANPLFVDLVIKRYIYFMLR
jgi:hypothetical protein